MATPYTDRAAVREMVARDSVSSGTAASLPDATLDSAIGRASNRIDSMLGSVYTVPFPGSPDTPAMVVDIATALAAYDADLTFREVRDYQSELTPILLRYTEAMDLLKQLQKGLATLPDYVPPDPDPGAIDAPGGDVIGVINPDLCEVVRPRHPSWMDQYYGWTL